MGGCLDPRGVSLRFSMDRAPQEGVLIMTYHELCDPELVTPPLCAFARWQQQIPSRKEGNLQTWPNQQRVYSTDKTRIWLGQNVMPWLDAFAAVGEKKS